MSVAMGFMAGLPGRQLWPVIWRATNGCLQLLALLFILLPLQPAVDIIHSHKVLIPDRHTKTSRRGQGDLPLYRTCCSPGRQPDLDGKSEEPCIAASLKNKTIALQNLLIFIHKKAVVSTQVQKN